MVERTLLEASTRVGVTFAWTVYDASALADVSLLTFGKELIG